MSKMMPSGGRRRCTRSIQAPDRSVSAARFRERGVDLYFRADAAFAKPELYELLEREGMVYWPYENQGETGVNHTAK